MKLLIIFAIWLAVEIIDNLSKRKKRRLPPPQTPPDFEIPTLTKSSNATAPIVLDSPRPPQPRRVPPKPPAQVQAEEPKPLNLSLTPSNVLNAVVMSELLGKPKALRRHR